MLQVTKVFNFETAHAIHQHTGMCKDIHGHSYELHVTVRKKNHTVDYLPELGIVMDFKDLKKIVNQKIVELLDHKLLISKAYLESNPDLIKLNNVFLWDYEPTAENILVFISKKIEPAMPSDIDLVKLRLYETKNSYAEWIR